MSCYGDEVLKKIYIELSDSCGLKCSFCPIEKNKRPKMTLDRFEKIIFEIASHKIFSKARICLHILGDPCRRSDLLDFIYILEKFCLKLDLVTSGYYQVNEKILDFHCLNQIAFSLDAGLDPNNPQKKDYLERILDFCALHMHKRSKSFINLRMQNISLDKNRVFLNQIFSFFKIQPNFSCFSRIKLAEYIFLVITQNFQWAGFSEDFTERRFCHGVKNQVGILSDGRVVPCCIDGSGKIVLGDIRYQKLEEILNSKRAIAMKQSFERGVALEPLCQNCHFPIKSEI